MSSRVDLLAGEEIIFSTSKHWLSPLRASAIPVAMLIAAWVLYAILPEAEGGIGGWFVGLLELVRTALVVGGIGAIIYHLIVWRTAVFAITDQRVLRDEGLAARRTSSTMLSAVTDVQTRVSFMGGRFGYGDVIVTGKAGSAAADRFLTISGPNRFRDRLMQAASRLVATEAAPNAAGAAADDPMTTLARLAELRDAGTLTVEEFEAKKAEILARI